jgi:hypothetical protein
MPPRQIHDPQQTVIYDYPVPDMEQVIVRRLPIDFRGGDNYQVVMDMECEPEELFDAMIDFELQAETSQFIDWVKVTEKTDAFIRLEMAMLPELHPGKFLYKYYPERENLRIHFWCYGVEGAGDGQVWDSIDVIVHVYPFGKFSRAILTENFTYCKGQVTPDATPIFAGVGHDVINRVKVRRERNKK